MRATGRFIITGAAALVVTLSVMAHDSPDAPAKANEASALTPVDQGNSKADLKVTAQIRKEVLASKNLSVDAQNVTIITNTGKITLRGPVDTADEKRRIGEIAIRYAEPGDVDNQIEVKAD